VVICRRYFYFLLFLFCYTVVSAQPLRRLNSLSYNVNEGLLYSQVTQIAEDGNSFIWIGTSTGIQRFDGKTFYTIEAGNKPGSLIDNRFVQFVRLQNGNLWLNSQKGITEYNIATNRFRNLIQLNPEQELQAISLGEEADGVWYWLSQKGFYKLNKSTHKFSDSITNAVQRRKISTAAGRPLLTGHFFIQVTSDALLVTARSSGKTQQFLSPVATRSYFFAVEKYKEDTVLIATARGVEKFNCRTGIFSLVCGYQTKDLAVNWLHPVQLNLVDKVICLVSEANKLFELNLQEGKYTAQLANMQNKDFPDVGYITGIFYDSHNNIWIMSENDGIRKVNYRFSGFKYFGTDSRKNNFVKTIYVDRSDNRVLCGTFQQGLLIFDSSQQLLCHINQFPGSKGPFTVCAFQKMASHQYLVILMGSWNMYLLNTENFSLKKATVNTTAIQQQIDQNYFPDYHFGLFPVNDSVCIVQSSFFTYRLTWKAPGKIVLSPLEKFDLPTISSFIDQQNRMWVGSQGKYYLSEPGFTHFKERKLPENKIVRCFCNTGKDQIWMGTEKGLYLLNNSGDIIQLLEKKDGLPDDNIYAVRKDDQNNLWMSHNKGISCRRTDGSFLHFSKNDGLQENEFNTNTSFAAANGELFFGGVNGISSFYPGAITDIKEQPSVLLSHIQIKGTDWETDTACWQVKKIVLPYYKNNILLDLVAIGNRSPDQYNYQYQLAGQDDEWINAGTNTRVRYVLQPGSYVFRYYAGNSFERDPQNAKQVIIIIEVPFWKTGWFISAMALLIAFTTIFITRYISQLKFKRKIEQLERKRMMDEERLRISREMHDDIGAGLTQIALMSERAKTKDGNNEPLEEIAGTSRKLTGSMSEIIWSMDPGNNTLQQLLGYLREQLNKLLEYSDIHYTISFPENGATTILNNAQRRNLLLVTKEIVHNTIKHSGAQNLFIECIAGNKQLHFTITDDGKGFDSMVKNTGNGLGNIKRRLQELNGMLEIISSSQGSRFIYSVPLQ
jgi:signal transduction histidine kinase